MLAGELEQYAYGRIQTWVYSIQKPQGDVIKVRVRTTSAILHKLWKIHEVFLTASAYKMWNSLEL